MNDYIFTFGSAVHCDEQQCGKLAKVAFDPDNWHVTELVVEEGLLLKRSRVFPITVVTRAEEKEINIAVPGDELQDYPEYKETVVETVPDNASVEPAMIQGSPYGLATSAPVVPVVRELIIQGVADHLDLLDRDTPVEAADTVVGKVYGVAVAPENGLITHVLVHKGTLFVEEFWLSTSAVERITTKAVFVNMTKDELDNLIEYDEEVDEDWDRLPTDEPLDEGVLDSGPIVDDSAVVDEDFLDKRAIENDEDIVMRDRIMNDESALAALIAEALMNDSRTENAVIEVIHERGMVTLQGRVGSPETKAAAQEIATAYPGVISVTNELVVVPR